MIVPKLSTVLSVLLAHRFCDEQSSGAALTPWHTPGFVMRMVQQTRRLLLTVRMEPAIQNLSFRQPSSCLLRFPRTSYVSVAEAVCARTQLDSDSVPLDATGPIYLFTKCSSTTAKCRLSTLPIVDPLCPLRSATPLRYTLHLAASSIMASLCEMVEVGEMAVGGAAVVAQAAPHICPPCGPCRGSARSAAHACVAREHGAAWRRGAPRAQPVARRDRLRDSAGDCGR